MSVLTNFSRFVASLIPPQIDRMPDAPEHEGEEEEGEEA
jgi:hypothetical protein